MYLSVNFILFQPVKKSLNFGADGNSEHEEKPERTTWSAGDIKILRRDGRSLIIEKTALNKTILEELLPSLCEKFTIAQLRTRINYERASKGKK